MRRTEENVELRKLQMTAANRSIEDIVNGMFVAAFVFSISYFLIFFYIT
jgi:hypothetical protein